jgi:hypothetical protein
MSVKKTTPGERKAKKALKELSASISLYLRHADWVMKQPESPKRGKVMAKLANALDKANDSVRFFELGVDYRKDKKPAPCPPPFWEEA